MGAAERFRHWVDSGRVDLPLPGSGDTGKRWAGLAQLGSADLAAARLAEGHADAAAILAELHAPPPAPGELWGVWAAVPKSLTAAEVDGAWRVSGERPWCSGAHTLTHALVTAETPGGSALFRVRVADATPVEGTWPATGMADSDSGAVRFAETPAEPVGEPGAYTSRPGFWHGGIGVAAVWFGAACAVAQPLYDKRDPDPHALAHLGAVEELLGTGEALFCDAARVVDADPAADAERLALRVRAAVERIATGVLDHVGRALGAGPLCADEAHGRRVADLTVYLRQSHAERDLARLGQLAVRS
ncbi:acyl-CoA dehydrogenase middle domain-containing protein [Actinokineospora bangkokensis]|nr:acyl-CoA/acyl-ACP dehydrogenase [Actinokineospora bangkokensis]